jgi:hypothetical protein
MRAFRTAILIAGFALLSAAAIAEPKAHRGYKIDTFSMSGAIFAGLSRDGDGLLVTDLASGKLYRRQSDGKLTVFGPIFPHGRDVIGDPTGPYRVHRDEARVISNEFWNPFDFIVSGNTYYVVDAARNSVERLEVDGGDRETFYAFSRIDQSGTALQRLSPTEFPEKSTYEVDAVPTGIALHERRIYVSLFGGFPFTAGAGKVVSVPEGDNMPALRVEFEGLNAPVDIAFDANGRVLVLEHGVYEQAIGFKPGTGRLLSFDVATGQPEVVLEGLSRPISVLVWDERQLVVSEMGGNLHFLTREMAN